MYRRKSVGNDQTQSSNRNRRSHSAYLSGKKASCSSITWGDNKIQIKMINEIVQCLSKKKVFVEIYSGPQANDRNLSDCEDDVLYALGAQIVKKLSKHTHYLVWQYGLLSTLEKAKEWNVKIVNPLWINECLTLKKEANYKDFPIMTLTLQETQELSKKDRGSFKRVKQGIQNIEEEEETDLINFKMRYQLSLFKEELKNIVEMPFNVPKVVNSQVLPEIIEETEQIQEQINENKNEEKSNKPSKNQIKRQQKIVNSDNFKPIIAFHKSCNKFNNEQLEQTNLKNFYNIAIEEEQKYKSHILIIDQHSLKYDLLFCYACLNKIQIISYDWIKDLQKNLLIEKDKYELHYPMPRCKFDHNFCTYFPKPKTQQQRNTYSFLRQAIEQVIQNFGGKITVKEHCEILLVMKNMFKQTALQILAELPRLKIIHSQWLFQSIQNDKLVDLNEFLIV